MNNLCYNSNNKIKMKGEIEVKKLKQKLRQEKGGGEMGFFGVVGAIITAVLLLAFC